MKPYLLDTLEDAIDLARARCMDICEDHDQAGCGFENCDVIAECPHLADAIADIAEEQRRQSIGLATS